MNRIKNTLLTFTGQLLLACAVALLTQPVAQAQTDVNVVNTPTVRIDSRANQVRINSSASSPVFSQAVERPFQATVRVSNSSPGTPPSCKSVPLPEGQAILVENVFVAGIFGDSNVWLVPRAKVFLAPGGFGWTEFWDEIPLSPHFGGRSGSRAVHFYVKGEDPLGIPDGQIYDLSICYKAMTPAVEVVALIVGRVLPQ